MKHYICILVIALVHQAIGFPVSEPSASVSPSVPALTPEVKGAELKSDTPITPVTGVLPDKTEIASPAAPQKEVTGGETAPIVEAEKSIVKDVTPVVHDAPKPSSSSPIALAAPTSSATVADEPATTHNKESVVKSNTDAVKSEVQTPEAPVIAGQGSNVAVEQQVAVSSEKPKEANNQVNSVSVDEPKPVRNEVKSEIPKEETKVADEQIKIEKLKDEVKSEKVVDTVKSENVKEEVKGVVADQVKSEKVAEEVTKSEKVETPVKDVIATSGEEVKPVSSEENVRKGDVSGSEEKNASVERVVVSEEKRESEEKNESAENKRESSSTSSEEVKQDAIANLKPTEKSMEEPKKDEKKEEKNEEKKEEKKPEEKKEEKKEIVAKDEKKKFEKRGRQNRRLSRKK